MTLIALCWSNSSAMRAQTNGQTDATKCIISLASRSIIMYQSECERLPYFSVTVDVNFLLKCFSCTFNMNRVWNAQYYGSRVQLLVIGHIGVVPLGQSKCLARWRELGQMDFEIKRTLHCLFFITSHHNTSCN